MDNLEILEKLKKALISHFSNNDIDRIVLFGSHSRGTVQLFSDYDILVVLKDDYDWVEFKRDEVDALFNDMKTYINKMQEIIKPLNTGLNKS